MDLSFYTNQLAASAEMIRTLAEGISPLRAAWKPAPTAWSALEVVNHLYDEEREDFRGHLEDLLARPGQPFREIAPQRWVSERGYNQRDWEASLAAFFAERSRSLEWLRRLDLPDAGVAYTLPWGSLSAGDLLASWAAHDLLHIRQLAELNYQLLAQASAPYQLRYAGDW